MTHIEPESMFADVIEQNGSLRITIDYKVAAYLGIKKGDRIKAWIKKIPKEGEE